MDNFFIAAFLLSLVASVVAIIKPSLFGRNGNTPSRLKAIGLISIISIVSFVGFGVTSNTETQQKTDTSVTSNQTTPETYAPLIEEISKTTKSESEPDTPTKIKKLVKNATKASEIHRVDNTKTLTLDLDMKNAWSDATLLSGSAMDMQEALEKIKLNFSGEYVLTHFNLHTNVIDKYNNTQKSKVLGITFDMEEVEKINFKNLTYQNLINDFVVKVGGGKVGKDITKAWCLDNQDSAPRFCKMAGAN